MRTINAGELQLLSSRRVNHHLRVAVLTSDGMWTQFAAFAGHNWIRSATWGEDIDQPVASAEVVLRREVDGQHIAPLMRYVFSEGGAMPFLNAGQRIRIDVAVTPPGAGEASFRRVFIGKIDEVDWTDPATLTLRARDLGAYLLDGLITEPAMYATTQGVPLEQVLQELIDDSLGIGAAKLYVPTPSGHKVYLYKQQPGRLGEILRTMAMQAGRDLRYRFDAAGNSRLTLWLPPREDEWPAHLFGANDYEEVQELAISDDTVRNIITVRWQDQVGIDRPPAVARDDHSIRLYGPRPAVFDGTATRHINAPAEASAMAVAAVKDLGYPYAHLAVRMPLWWPVQLGDVYQFAGNGSHHAAPLMGAVVGFTHHFEHGHGSTTIRTRGKPVGGIAEWLRRERIYAQAL